MNFQNKWIITIIVVPIIIMLVSLLLIICFGSEKASQIGGAVGGITSPVLSLAALIMIVITYFYQKKHDDKNNAKEIILKQLDLLMYEYENTYTYVVITKDHFVNPNVKRKIAERVKIYGRETFTEYGRKLIIKQEGDDTTLTHFINNIFKGFNAVVQDLNNQTKQLSDNDISFINSLLKLKYLSIYVPTIAIAHKMFKEDKLKNDDKLGDTFFFPDEMHEAIQNINNHFEINDVQLYHDEVSIYNDLIN